MDLLPVRKPIRLAAKNYLGLQSYFVTLCCSGGQSIFSDVQEARQLLALLRSESAQQYFRVHAYCIMPDHVHFLLEGTEPQSDFLHFMKTFKIKSSRKYGLRRMGVLWQRGFYEHILRPGDKSESVAWYIWLNPVRNGLVSVPQEFEFAGSFTGMKMPSVLNATYWRLTRRSRPLLP